MSGLPVESELLLLYFEAFYGEAGLDLFVFWRVVGETSLCEGFGHVLVVVVAEWEAAYEAWLCCMLLIVDSMFMVIMLEFAVYIT